MGYGGYHYLDGYVGSFFPPQLLDAIEILLKNRLIEPERRMGPFLRDVLHLAGNDAQLLYEEFEDHVPLREAASLLVALHCLEQRLRLRVKGSLPELEKVVSGRNVRAIVEAAFDELARCE